MREKACVKKEETKTMTVLADPGACFSTLGEIPSFRQALLILTVCTGWLWFSGLSASFNLLSTDTGPSDSAQ
jgi:hypothetical protein